MAGPPSQSTNTRRLKVQLHCHSARSFDSHWPVHQLRSAYGERGFVAIFLTDHDRSAPSAASRLSRRGLPILLPGAELSLSIPFWPLGPHLVLLGLERIPPALRWAALRPGWPGQPWGKSKLRDLFAWLAQSDHPPVLPVLAHPHWSGNLGTGRWAQYFDLVVDAWQQLPSGSPLFVEGLNPHSPTDEDRQLWHALLGVAGRTHPLYIVGTDDAHHPGEAGQAWIELIQPENGSSAIPTRADIYRSLSSGSFTATSGPWLQTRVAAASAWRSPLRLQVWAEPGIHLRLVGKRGDLLQEATGPLVDWPLPPGIGEGAVQVEAYSPSAHTVSGSFWPDVAFSQPIWT